MDGAFTRVAAAAAVIGFAAASHAALAQATDTLVYRFGSSPGDGLSPEAGVVLIGKTFYGTTSTGGANGLGTVYSVTPAGVEKVLYSFQGGTDGSNPATNLVAVGGVLYGVTPTGGANGLGTVYSVTTSGVETVLYSFQGGTDGATPGAALVNDKGVLYGTTVAGGTGSAVGCKTGGCGTVFSVTTTGTEKVVYSFQGGNDGVSPNGLNLHKGQLYGTTTYGGGIGCASAGCGTVFKVTVRGVEQVLYSFLGGADGSAPHTGLVNTGGNFYGVTLGGGSSGFGTIFTVNVGGVEKVLHAFTGGADGAYPLARLSKVSGSTTIYGTTKAGGGSFRCTSGCGTIFSITPSGTETVLYAFQGGADGASPYSNLLDYSGVFYGTTDAGGEAGVAGNGTVYSIPVP